MHKRFDLVFEGRRYEAIANVLAHDGRAVLIILTENTMAVGSAKFMVSWPQAVLKLGNLSAEELLDRTWSQFIEQQLAGKVLSSAPRPIIVEFE
jgi:hypothetical protein